MTEITFCNTNFYFQIFIQFPLTFSSSHILYSYVHIMKIVQESGWGRPLLLPLPEKGEMKNNIKIQQKDHEYMNLLPDFSLTVQSISSLTQSSSSLPVFLSRTLYFSCSPDTPATAGKYNIVQSVNKLYDSQSEIWIQMWYDRKRMLKWTWCWNYRLAGKEREVVWLIFKRLIFILLNIQFRKYLLVY